MKETTTDTIIIGAGIVGCSVALELSKSKDNIHVIEAKEISSQTSSSSSKMLHGGIRYLENLDFKLVFEALREKNYWIKKKPHLAKEAVFYLPVYKDSKWPLIAMKMGVFLYNFLSGFKNKSYPSLNKQDFSKRFPMVKTDGLKGAAAYSDAVIDDKEFTIEIAKESILSGVTYHEKTEVLGIEKKGSGYKVETSKGTFNCNSLIVCSGPFTDKVMNTFDNKWKDIMLLSKGVHLWIKKESLQITDNIVLQTKDNRVIFIINHEDKVLIGTTEQVIKKEELNFDIKPELSEIEYILENVNTYLGDAFTITKDDILSSFSGIRPLVRDHSKSSTKTSREHVTLEPADNFYVITGGKYTTCRVMAKQLVKKIKS